MSEITLTALVLLPADGAPYDRVDAVCAECLDLADVQVNRVAAAPDDAPHATVWADVEGKLEVCDFVMVDFSPAGEANSVDANMLVQATIARFAHRKPVVVLHHGEPAFPLGWVGWRDTFAYQPTDDGFVALKKALNKRLVTLVTEIEENLVETAGRPAGPAATGSASPEPAAASVAAPGGDPDEAARMKAVLRERFRKRLSGDVSEAGKEDEAPAKEPETAKSPAPSAPGATAGAPGGDRPVGAPPGAKGGGATGAAAAAKGAEQPVSEQQKKSRLLELQEKLKRNEAQAAAPQESSDDAEDDLGFDLNIDLDGDAPVKVTSGLSNKVRAGELMADQVKPDKRADDDDSGDDDSDDDLEIDASDIDILKDIRTADRRKKKKRKKKTGARPNPDTAARKAAAAKKAAAEKSSGSGGGGGGARSGLGLLTDKRTGQRLELRKDELKIGRVPGRNDVVLAEGQVSSSHCRIFRRDNGYFIVDMGSTNGTYVNDEMVSTKQAHRLKDDDRITIAKTKETPNGAREFVFNQHP